MDKFKFLIEQKEMEFSWYLVEYALKFQVLERCITESHNVNWTIESV